MDGTRQVTSPRRSTTPIDAALQMGPVRLIVRDIDTMTSFWHQHVGLHAMGSREGVHALGAGGEVLIELEHRPDAPLAHPRAGGLYHVALRVPTRRDLALVLHRASQRGTPLQGASDHLVSEALYLVDPEGNGIEIYRDRPREHWAWGDAGLAMATEPLDIDGVLGELTGQRMPDVQRDSDAGMPQGTVVGHVHLRATDVAAAEDWYVNVVGLDVTTRYGDSASFLSAGGYHHHLGLNAWHSRGGPAPEPDSAGLAHYTMIVRHADELRSIAERARAAGTAVEELPRGATAAGAGSGGEDDGGAGCESDDAPAGIALRDTSGVLLHLRAADAKG